MGFKGAFTTVVFFLLAAALFQMRRGEELPARRDFSTPHSTTDFEALEIPRGEHALAGRVSHADGAPAAGVLVELRAGTEPRWTFTGADGRFELTELPAGEQQLVLVQPGHLPAERTVRVPSESDVELALPPAWESVPLLPDVVRGPLVGRLQSALGDSIEGFEVVLRPGPETDPLSGATVRRAACDAMGVFRFDELVAASYALEVLPPWAAGGSWPVLARSAVRHDAVAPSLGSVRLESGALAGRASDADGQPLFGALVRVSDAADPNLVWPPVATDEDGAFRIGDLAPGRYRVRLRAGAVSEERVVEVRAGELRDPGFGLESPE